MSVYPRGKKKVYYMDFTLFGQRVFRSTGKYTEREARIIEAKEMERIENEIRNPHKKPESIVPTILEAAKKCYEERWKYNKDGEKSYIRAKKAAELLGENKRLDEIDYQEIINLIKQLEKTGIEYSTINRYLASLRTVFYMALRDWKVINDIPTFKLKRETEGRIREISKEEESQILRYFYSNDLVEIGDLCICLIDTGMRLSEFLNLEFKDIDFECKLIRIWENKANYPRAVPLTTRVFEILQKRRKEGTQNNKPFSLSVDQAEKLWNKVRVKLEMDSDPEFVIHALRHTCACRLIRKGVNLVHVQRWLGHKSIKTTERYVHVIPQDLLSVVGRLEE